MGKEDKFKSQIMLVTAMVIYGTIGIFRRFIPLGSAELALIRGFMGAICMLVVIGVQRKGIDFAVIKKKIVYLLVSGAFIGFNWILLFEAYNYTTIAVATLCYYMAPIFVLILSPIFLKEKIGVKQCICVLVALVGMVLVSGVLNNDGKTDYRGILFGLGAALLYASVIMLNQKLKEVNAYDKTLFQLGAAAIALLPYVMLTSNGEKTPLNAFAICMIFVVGIIHTGLAYALYFGSMGKVPAQTVALFGYIDPVVAICLSTILLSEPMGILEIIGMVLILGATIIHSYKS